MGSALRIYLKRHYFMANLSYLILCFQSFISDHLLMYAFKQYFLFQSLALNSKKSLDLRILIIWIKNFCFLMNWNSHWSVFQLNKSVLRTSFTLFAFPLKRNEVCISLFIKTAFLSIDNVLLPSMNLKISVPVTSYTSLINIPFVFIWHCMTAFFLH